MNRPTSVSSRTNGHKPTGRENQNKNGDQNTQSTVLITGGAGFIGTNLAHRLLQGGHRVVVYDNLSRAGVEANLRWLVETHPTGVQVEIADVRDRDAIARVVQGVDMVFHFAAQVAVTTSLVDPVMDFDVNAGGTLNVLEALRNLPSPPPLVFTSTNKVYGSMNSLQVVMEESRYRLAKHALWQNGVSETFPLDFHSPYGCSKGVADQYVLDYARTYGLQTAVFRMSCIYGLHQCGTEDQGWVAHFVRSAIENQPLTLYGDGRQVRDVLYVDDLVEAFLLAARHMPTIAGEAFNIGGGVENTVSLRELLDLLTEITGDRPITQFDGWRPGDQRYFVSDTSKFAQMTGWKPRVSVEEGVRRLHDWLVENGSDISQPLMTAHSTKQSVNQGAKEML